MLTRLPQSAKQTSRLYRQESANCHTAIDGRRFVKSALAGFVLLATFSLSVFADDRPLRSQDESREQSGIESTILAIELIRSELDGDEYFEIKGFDPPPLARFAATNPGFQAWSHFVPVVVADGKANSSVPMLGKYTIIEGMIRFNPRFPLQEGLSYRVQFDAAKAPFVGGTRERQLVTKTFTIPKSSNREPVRVRRIFPSSDTLPENTLKFYIHFSGPMNRGEAYKRVHLIHSSGREIDSPFLELGEELWDPSGTRFTLFLDPGRIKRGLQPRELFGPPLVEGDSYTLLVDKEWTAPNGSQLRESYRKSFRVFAPDDIQPAIDNWKVQTPSAGTTEPLQIRFEESLDEALLQRMLVVRSADGRPVRGTIKVSDHEKSWDFEPEADWQPGPYQVDINAALEDVSGNSIGRPFEVDLFRKVEREVKSDWVSIPFEINGN